MYNLLIYKYIKLDVYLLRYLRVSMHPKILEEVGLLVNI